MKSATRSRFSTAPSRYTVIACSISGVSPSSSADSARSTRLSSIWNNVSAFARSIEAAISATTAPLPLSLSGIESLLHVIEDPYGLLRIQPRLRIEAQFTKDLRVLGVPQSPLSLSEARPKCVQQHPVDVASLLQARNAGHFSVAVTAENVAIFRR